MQIAPNIRMLSIPPVFHPAWYSKGRRSSMVPVDYTRRRYVKKPSGAAPGKVIYTHQKTAYMTVEEAEIRGIRLAES